MKTITNPERPPASITILPMFSGQRGTNGRMELTTNYRPVYEAVEKDPRQFNLGEDWAQTFEIVIRADQIATLNQFSPKVYATFRPNFEATIGTPKASAPQQLIVKLSKDRGRTDWRPSPRD